MLLVPFSAPASGTKTGPAVSHRFAHPEINYKSMSPVPPRLALEALSSSLSLCSEQGFYDLG